MNNLSIFEINPNASLIHPFSSTLLTWYRTHARDLPWRHTKDPYVIWLSEVVLQQTRVAQGLPYFHTLLAAFPRVQDLAEAEEATLFRLWQGLGYYSRARNLHKTAKHVVASGGEFPKSYSGLITLPGIGPYTAAAIASFAFNEASPVVDGNVFRILARHFGIETDILHSSARKIFTELAQELIPNDQPATFNQAIMEFGSLQCSPVPQCPSCPLVSSCVAHATGRTLLLPLKSKKKPVRERFLAYFIFEQRGKILVRQRTGKDIWAGLWEFYLVELADFEQSLALLAIDPVIQAWFSELDSFALKAPAPHLLSHQKLISKAWHIQVPDHFNMPQMDEYQWIEPEDFKNVGKPVLLLNLITDNLSLQELF